MRITPVIITTAALAVSLALGCAKDEAAPAADDANEAAAANSDEAAAASAPARHAPKDFEPGSHEDWCGEHAVPESQCTRCNPSLIAAFKATGDWCDAHGLPESQCTACNPDLEIERPPKSAAPQ